MPLRTLIAIIFIVLYPGLALADGALVEEIMSASSNATDAMGNLYKSKDSNDPIKIDYAERNATGKTAYLIGLYGYISRKCDVYEDWEKLYSSFFNSMPDRLKEGSYSSFKEGWSKSIVLLKQEPLGKPECTAIKYSMAAMPSLPARKRP